MSAEPCSAIFDSGTFRRYVVMSFSRGRRATTEPHSDAGRRAPPRPGRRGRIIQLLLLFVASVIVIDGLVGDRGLLAMMRARREYDTAAAAVARQRAENARLREEAAAFGTIPPPSRRSRGVSSG